MYGKDAKFKVVVTVYRIQIFNSAVLSLRKLF